MHVGKKQNIHNPITILASIIMLRHCFGILYTFHYDQQQLIKIIEKYNDTAKKPVLSFHHQAFKIIPGSVTVKSPS